MAIDRPSKPRVRGIEDPQPKVLRAPTLIETAIRLGVLVVLLYWSLLLIRPFASIIIWTTVVTVALYPAFERLTNILHGRDRVTAALITLLALLFVIGPAVWFALGLIEGIRVVVERLDASILAIRPPPQAVKAWPLIGESLYQFWALAATNAAAAASAITPQLKPLAATLVHVGASTAGGIAKFLLSIVIAGFIFPIGPRLADAIKALAKRLNPEQGVGFVVLAGATIRAVSRGVIGISVFQAVLAGIGFSAAGVPQASVLTFAVLICGIVQIGPAIVLIPVILWSWMTMDTVPALLFTVYFGLVNVVDNVLKPIVMGRGLKTPMLVILIGAVGGVLSYGITGVFLGPIVLVVIWDLLVAWLEERPEV